MKTYQEIAEESFKDWGYYYPPKSWEEFNEWTNKSYEKYLKEDEDDVIKTKSYVSLLHTIDDFGFYIILRISETVVKL